MMIGGLPTPVKLPINLRTNFYDLKGKELDAKLIMLETVNGEKTAEIFMRIKPVKFTANGVRVLSKVTASTDILMEYVTSGNSTEAVRRAMTADTSIPWI